MTRPALAAAVLAAALPSLALADPPKVTGELSVPAYRLVKLAVADPAPKVAYVFDVSPRTDLSVADTARKGVFQFVAPPGVYEVKVQSFRVADDGEPVIETAYTTVTIGDAKPRPKPVPDDDPKPAPGPTAAHVYLAVVRDPSAVTPAQARLLGDTAFWDSFKAAGHEWDSYANTSPELVRLKYLPLAQKVQTGTEWVPTLILLDKDTGRELKTVPLPADKAGVTAALKEVTK